MKHSLIDLWTAEHDLPLDTRGARRQVALTIDKVRMHLRELSNGDVLASARVADIPADPRNRDDVVTRAMKVATARMRSSRAVLATDQDAAALTLQLIVPAGADVQAMDKAVEHLVNEVDAWRALL